MQTRGQLDNADGGQYSCSSVNTAEILITFLIIRLYSLIICPIKIVYSFSTEYIFTTLNLKTEVGHLWSLNSEMRPLL